MPREPDRLALRFAGESMTFGELERRSFAIAAGLVAQGIGRESVIALAMPRSIELATWFWGAWRAGAAVLPLDPAYPPERLRYMIDDAKPALVVTEGHAPAWAAATRALPAIDRRPDDLAYVIYTSGSTGRPKGVEVLFRGITNLAHTVANIFEISRDSRVLSFASPSFDVYVGELVWSLLNGASLHIPSAVEARPGRELAAFCAREAITVATFPPSVLAILEPADYPSIRTIVSGSEACSPSVVRRWAPGRRFVNAYGPTEATVCATGGQVTIEDVARGAPSIGRAFPYVEAWVIDGAMQPVADGTVGELVLAGNGIARGYRGDPAATAAAFLPHPRQPGTRAYRTGDLVRRDPDGRIYFLGRIDDQIKLRGFRIELGEIEHALRALPAIADAAVVVRTDQLVAHVVARVPLDRAALRAELARSLPAHMIPAAVVEHAALPRSPAGKVDRKALAALAADGHERAAYVAPATPVEQALAGIWGDLLEVDRVGTGDDFFALGGHSLSAVRMISRVRAQLGVELPLRSVFAARTLAAIAHEIERGEREIESITVASRDGDLPLSFEQQRLWFLHELDPSPAYNLPFAMRMRGALDVEALRRAFEGTLARHEVLRTVIDAVGGVPRQRILPPSRFELALDDLAAFPDREREAARRVDAIGLAVFDLARGPLLVARLLRLAADDHVLVVNVHHIAFDGWSHELLLRELAAGYGGARLPALPVQFADYAVWQRRVQTREKLDRDLAYWKATLADAPELGLPHRGPRPEVQTHRGGRVAIHLAPELASALRGLAMQHGSTQFTLMLAALRALLASYTGRRDVCLGTAIANRGHRDLEDVIGFFVNTVVLRGQVTERDTFADLLARETQGALAAYTHDAQFELVVDALGVKRSLDRMPLVEVVCVDQGEVGELALPGLACEPFETDLALARFDLTVDIRERAGTREVVATYNTDLFERAAIAELLARYERLLRAIACEPRTPLAEIDLQWAAPRDARPVPAPVIDQDTTIHDLVAANAVATPAAIAVVFGDVALTYAELDRRSNQLAHFLVREGVGPGSIVGIALERSLEMIVSLLGILKAGAAYAPLDPEYPHERLRYMIEDAAIRIVLVARAHRAAIPCARVIVVEDHADAIAGEPTERPAITARPDSLAYVMYTSGSTGLPKGVCVEHRAVVRLVYGNDFVAVAPDDVFAQAAPLAFDASTFEIWMPLANGARLAVMPPGPTSTALLGQALVRDGVTTLWLTAALFDAMVDDHLSSLRGLRNLLTGGDVLSVPHVTKAYRALPSCRLINGYGPTENTTFTTCFTIAEDPGRLSSIPIGTAIRGTTTIVLDDDGVPVAPGVIGELYTGGLGLARGYLGQPALTAERFISDPSGARLYRTGDLVRMRDDGVLEFVGRRDQQVKIRGFRIELGEIEHQLARHPAVARACVLAREDRPGDRRLVAYVVARTQLDVRELRAHLARVLPAHMVPSAYVELAELPMTANGKLDRRALPPPPDDAAIEVAPRTATEHALARIWCEVLGRDKVGIHDNFFSRGGHSLLVMRLVARISHELGVDLRPRDVFERPTIAEQAEQIDRHVRIETGEGARELLAFVTGLSPAEVSARLADWQTVALDVRPSTQLAGERRALLERLLAQHEIDLHPSRPLARRDASTAPATWDQEVNYEFHERGNFPNLTIQATAFAVRGPLDTPALQRAIAALVERQPALRTTFVREDGRLLQTVQPRGCELEVVDVSHATDREAAARAAFAELSAPHDVSREVFRARLVRMTEHEHVLMLSANHVILDGFSQDVLELDLAALYRAFSQGTEPALAPLALQFNDFTFWQRTLEERPVGRAQLAFWANAVAGYDGLELPVPGKPRGAVGFALDTYRNGFAPFVLGGDDWRAALACCARYATTPYTVLATAYYLTLARWAGRSDVCAISGNFHRNRPGSEAVVGSFVTPYPMRFRFDDAATLEDAVRSCHAAILAHREHTQVAPISALATWSEWSRYNLNYLIDIGAEANDFGAVAVERLDWSPFELRTAHDLGLFVRQGAAGLRGVMSYNAERFSFELVTRAVTRVCQLVRTIATAPATRIASLPTLVE